MNKTPISFQPPAIVGRALLVLNDTAIVGHIADSMREFAIATDVCQDMLTAIRLINIRKFEAIVVDLESGAQAATLLHRVRVSPSNRNSVTFALARSDERFDYEVRPTFLMQKPLNDALVKSTLRAALGLIMRDYRRYFRCPIVLPVIIQVGNATNIRCETMNISEGGLAIRTSGAFKPGSAVTAKFVLPGESRAFQMEAEICWNDNSGHAGLQFRSSTAEQKALLQGWLSSRIEEALPEAVARLFHKA